MAAGPITQVADAIVPEVFNPYVQQLTTEKSAIIQSGALAPDPALSALLAGGGLTFHTPSFRDLDNDVENVSSDEADDRITGQNNNAVPKKIRTAQETSVRLSRNQHWSSADLTAALAGVDPMDAIARLVAGYWARRLQPAFIATMAGVFANNTANENDMTNDISGTAYTAGVTDFSADAFIDTTLTLDDSMDELGLILCHPVVKAGMAKKNLIETRLDSDLQPISFYQGMRVITDKAMPSNAGVYETWMFSSGAVRFGQGQPKVPTVVTRDELAGNGGGAEILHNRTEWVIHPVGYAYVGAPPDGGPANNATSTGLANGANWARAYSERNQIKIARLITRER